MHEAITIGNLHVSPPLVLGPMAGYTAMAFRLLCRRAGAGLVTSEMISARALEFGSRKTAVLMATCTPERPVALQIFGAAPKSMAAAAREAVAAGADIVDINMGCTVPKVCKTGAGVALMAEPRRAVEVTAAVCRAVPVPVTVKFRAGMQGGDNGYLELGQRLQDAGAAALTLHARPASAGFRGSARWETIARLVERVQVPVIGSGDVVDARAAVRLLAETGCAAAMFARGCLGRPWVFTQAAELLAGREPAPEPEAPQRLAIALCHAQMLALQGDELRAARQMRTHIPFYCHGLPRASWLRLRCQSLKSLAEIRDLFLDYLATTQAGAAVHLAERQSGSCL